MVVTLSDGVSYLRCFVSPQVYHVFDEKVCIKNSILRVGRFVYYNAVVGIQVILLDVSVQSSECLVIGKPSAWQNHKKCRVEDEPDGAANVKFITFMHNNNNNENDANKEGKIVGSDVGKDTKLNCDECCQNPCNWTKYGPCLLIQINNMSMLVNLLTNTVILLMRWMGRLELVTSSYDFWLILLLLL